MIKYKIIYKNEDGSNWELHVKFSNNIELNDFIETGAKFGKLPVEVKVI